MSWWRHAAGAQDVRPLRAALYGPIWLVFLLVGSAQGQPPAVLPVPTVRVPLTEYADLLGKAEELEAKDREIKAKDRELAAKDRELAAERRINDKLERLVTVGDAIEQTQGRRIKVEVDNGAFWEAREGKILEVANQKIRWAHALGYASTGALACSSAPPPFGFPIGTLLCGAGGGIVGYFTAPTLSGPPKEGPTAPAIAPPPHAPDAAALQRFADGP